MFKKNLKLSATNSAIVLCTRERKGGQAETFCNCSSRIHFFPQTDLLSDALDVTVFHFIQIVLTLIQS